MKKKLHFAVFVEEGTNPTEFNYCRLRLKEAGFRVTVIGRNKLEYRLEDHSLGYADMTAAELEVTGSVGATDGQDKPEYQFDGVVIPGGLGPEKLRHDARIVRLVKKCYEMGKPCAAICHGQQILISAGLMQGVRATAAWSMMDDLRAVGAIVPEGVRSIRDNQIITAIFPRDLPDFFKLIFEALTEAEDWSPPSGYPERLSGQKWGIVVDNASDATQVLYLKLRIQEDGGSPILLGRRHGTKVTLSSPEWEWGEFGLTETIDRALPNPGVIASCDTEADVDSGAITGDELDGLLLPGGLGTWMVRGHPGLRNLIEEVHAGGKPIGAVGRGPKLLMLTSVLENRTVTCAPQMLDDIVYSTATVDYADRSVVLDGNLLTCRGTEELPEFMGTLIDRFQ